MKKMIVFSMQGCNPCKQLKENLNKAGLVTNIEFYDVSEDMNLAKHYNIRSVPTTLVIDEDGKVCQRVSGNIQVSDLIQLVETS